MNKDLHTGCTRNCLVLGDIYSIRHVQKEPELLAVVTRMGDDGF